MLTSAKLGYQAVYHNFREKLNVRLCDHYFVHSFILSFVPGFVRLFFRSFACSFAHSFPASLARPFVHPLVLRLFIPSVYCIVIQISYSVRILSF